MNTIRHIAVLAAAALSLAAGQPAQARTASGYLYEILEHMQEEALKQQIRTYCAEEMYTIGGYVACVKVLFEENNLQYAEEDIYER